MSRVAEAFHADVLSCEMLAPRVTQLMLARSDGRPLLFEPGQWVKVSLPTPGGEVRRAYSIASAPHQSAQFELAITSVHGGVGSSYLCALQPGATLRVHGPHGFFTRQATDACPALFVGTGTGITPLRSMLLAAVQAQSTVPLWILIGVRHEEDLLYRLELERLARQHPNVRVFFTLSRPPETWRGLQGYVQLHVPALWEELVALDQGQPHLFVCGLERMVSIVRSLARNTMNLPRERLHTERYD